MDQFTKLNTAILATSDAFNLLRKVEDEMQKGIVITERKEAYARALHSLRRAVTMVDLLMGGEETAPRHDKPERPLTFEGLAAAVGRVLDMASKHAEQLDGTERRQAVQYDARWLKALVAELEKA